MRKQKRKHLLELSQSDKIPESVIIESQFSEIFSAVLALSALDVLRARRGWEERQRETSCSGIARWRGRGSAAAFVL